MPSPHAGAARARDAADPGRSEVREPAVGGGLGGELAQRGEREIDRGRGQPALDQMRALAPEHQPL